MKMMTRAILCGGWSVMVLAGCAAQEDQIGARKMTTTIRRDKDQVVLEGVQGWFCGEKESSVHAAQEAVMKAMGEDISYEYLVGVSGLAFRMQVHKEGLCPSSPHPFVGRQCVARSTQALGHSLKLFECKPDQTEKVAEARAAVVESIERGIPVQYGSKEDGVIIGYRKGGAEWICLHPYRDGGKKPFVETKWPWGIAIWLPEKQDVRPKRVMAVEVLKQAVEMAAATEAGEYWLGWKAWDEYIKTVEGLDKADDKARNDAMMGNSWIYECLAQYRGCAAWYLRDVADEFDADAAKHLLAAADLYDRMSSEVLRDEEACVITVAPQAWALKDGQTWTSEMRAGQVKRLKAALELEKQAIAEIEKALALIEG